jgi:hypothetical protein
MDEIETGFAKIMEKIDELKKNEGALADKVRKNDAKLLSRMAAEEGKAGYQGGDV